MPSASIHSDDHLCGLSTLVSRAAPICARAIERVSEEEANETSPP
jgi:hypothetical protein